LFGLIKSTRASRPIVEFYARQFKPGGVAPAI
jgi:hypothetical protein